MTNGIMLMVEQMNPTQEQIKTLIGEKCIECNGLGSIYGYDEASCQYCKGTGLPTIEIKKEWRESRK